MALTYLLLAVLLLLLIINIVFTLRFVSRDPGYPTVELKNEAVNLRQTLKDSEASLKGEFVINRQESAGNAKGLREEVSGQLNAFTKTFSEQLTALTHALG